MRYVILACALTLAACIGPRATPNALFPPAQLAWPAVEEDFHRGIADGVEDGDLSEQGAEALRGEGDRLEAALDARDVAELRTVPWLSLEPWAERGIDDKLEDGDVGPGVAASLREQLAHFTEVIVRLQGVR